MNKKRIILLLGFVMGFIITFSLTNQHKAKADVGVDCSDYCVRKTKDNCGFTYNNEPTVCWGWTAKENPE